MAGSWSAELENDHRAEFAEQLHYVDDFVNARAVLESVLATEAHHPKAVILMGDIGVHEANWPAALEWTALARELFPGSVDARLDRIDALIGSASWNEALREISDGSRERAKLSEWDVELLIGDGRQHWVERLRAAGLSRVWAEVAPKPI